MSALVCNLELILRSLYPPASSPLHIRNIDGEEGRSSSSLALVSPSSSAPALSSGP